MSQYLYTNNSVLYSNNVRFLKRHTLIFIVLIFWIKISINHSIPVLVCQGLETYHLVIRSPASAQCCQNCIVPISTAHKKFLSNFQGNLVFKYSVLVFVCFLITMKDYSKCNLIKNYFLNWRQTKATIRNDFKFG